MSNQTAATEAPFYDLGLGVPLWVIIVWAAVGVILVAMVVLILYVCRTRKRIPGHERNTEEEELDQHERQRSITLIDTYPQGFVEELHTIKEVPNKNIFPPTFGNSMRIPRAAEVKMIASENGTVKVADLHHTAAENSALTLDELTISISNYDYGNVDEDDFTELHTVATNRKINISRDASFRTSNISEENKARQLLREKMLVNELREKIRRERRTIDEDS